MRSEPQCRSIKASAVTHNADSNVAIHPSEKHVIAEPNSCSVASPRNLSFTSAGVPSTELLNDLFLYESTSSPLVSNGDPPFRGEHIISPLTIMKRDEEDHTPIHALAQAVTNPIQNCAHPETPVHKLPYLRKQGKVIEPSASPVIPSGSSLSGVHSAKTRETLAELHQVLSPRIATKPPIKKSPQLVRQYSTATPSRFCHVCARSGTIAPLLPCKNIKYGMCRKAICRKCFGELGWDWEKALTSPDKFSCCHCIKLCPTNAQCRTYTRTNERRRANGLRKRLLIEETLAGGGDIEAVLRKSTF